MAGGTKNKRGVLVVNDVEFETVRIVPGWTFIEFTRTLKKQKGSKKKSNEEQVEQLTEMADTIYDMFESVMEPEEFERFRKFARSPDGPDLETLMAAIGDLAVEGGDRPTGPSSS